MWFIGVYYPAGLVGNGIDGYVIPSPALPNLARRLVGCPITFEHAGIAAAAQVAGPHPTAGTVITALQSISKKSQSYVQRAVSVVESTYQNANGEWCCIFSLDPQLFPRLIAMIMSGSLRGLSLSHLERGGDGRVPLEVSLCRNPARDRCYIRGLGLQTPLAVSIYKAIDIEMTTTSIIAAMSSESAATTPPSAPSTDINDILKTMTESQRGLVSAALDTMNEKLAAAEKKAADASEEAEVMRNAQNIDKALLQSQIETFISQIGQDTTRQFGLTSKSCADALNSNNPDALRRQIDRMLMCCNTHMMQAKSGAAIMPNTSMNTIPESNEDVAVPVQSTATKRKAEHIEPTDTDAATQLRAALSNF